MPRNFGGTQRRHIRNNGVPVTLETTTVTVDQSTEWEDQTETTETAQTRAIFSVPNQPQNVEGEAGREINVDREVALPGDIVEQITISDGEGEPDPTMITNEESGVSYVIVQFDALKAAVFAEVTRK